VQARYVDAPGTGLERARGRETMGRGGAGEPLRPESHARVLLVEGHDPASCLLGMPQEIPILPALHRAMPKHPPLLQPDEVSILSWEEWPVVEPVGVLDPDVAVALQVGPCGHVHGEVSLFPFCGLTAVSLKSAVA
jgi:hypothetical protein